MYGSLELGHLICLRYALLGEMRSEIKKPYILRLFSVLSEYFLLNSSFGTGSSNSGRFALCAPA